MTGFQVAQRIEKELANLTGLKPDTVSAVAPNDGGWKVVVEIIELKRIPASTDVLASYEVVTDDKGNLLSYKRTRRYLRSQVMETT